MMWKCVGCGHEEEDRWLMCPECTTPEDWQEMRGLGDRSSLGTLNPDAVSPCNPFQRPKPKRSGGAEQS